jgi:acyl-CoA dehydrogenase
LDFAESEQHVLIRQSIAQLLKRFPAEYWRAKDAQGEFPQEFWGALGESGWLGATVPTEYGGAGLGLQEAVVILHELARQGGVPAADLAMRSLIFAAFPISRYGTPALKERYLPRLAQGKLLTSFAHTEPGAGVNTFDITTYARRLGDHYLLKGQKVWITLAHRADLIIVVARTRPKDETSSKAQGLSLVAVDTQASPVKTAKIEGLAMRPLGSNEVFFDDVRVPRDHLLGVEDHGWEILTALLNAERVGTAAMAIGAGELVLDRAVQYAKERQVFGRAIGTNQAIQFPLAQVRVELEAALLLAQKAAWELDHGHDGAFAANAAALLGGQAGFRAADRAIQTLGGMGFARENDVERYFRDLRLFRSAPVPEEMVLSYIAQHVLGLPRSF